MEKHKNHQDIIDIQCHADGIFITNILAHILQELATNSINKSNRAKSGNGVFLWLFTVI